MSIKTKSLFFYGQIIDENNFALDFKEGAITYQADVPVGDYALSEFVSIIEQTMSNVGGQEYTVSVDRSTRLISISAPTDFELLVDTGRETSLYPLIGFSGADKVGTNNYTASSACGSEWRPQSVLENYVPKEHNEEAISPSVNETTNGEIETLTFGDRVFIEGNARYITNIAQSAASPFDTDLSGEANAIAFLKHAKTKSKFEFMPDRDDVNEFTVVLLERIRGSQSGTGFKLERMFSEAGQRYYETGLMVMRVI